jgi:hypothetical protein
MGTCSGYYARGPTTALKGCSLPPTSIRQNTRRQRMQRRSLLRASDMTVFIGVEGAVQHGLSMTGILLILVLFTCLFPAYVCMLAFFRR